MQVNLRTSVLGFCLVAGLPGVAHAWGLVYMPLVTQTNASDVVVRGRVLSKVADFNPQRTAIFTTFSLEVLESFKGSHQPGEPIPVRYLGGTSPDQFNMEYHGMPEVDVNDEIVLFLVSVDGGVLTPWGLKQSVMQIGPNPETGQSEVVRDLGEINFVDEFLEGETPFERLALVEFRERIQTILAGQ